MLFTAGSAASIFSVVSHLRSISLLMNTSCGSLLDSSSSIVLVPALTSTTIFVVIFLKLITLCNVATSGIVVGMFFGALIACLYLLNN